MSDYSKEDGGIFFDPSDKELIEYYLAPKLRGDTSAYDFILDKDVYAKEPWLLDHTKYPFFMEDEWYYFVTRSQISEKNVGCGKNTKRKITDGGGSWKPNAKALDIIDEKTKKIIGTKKTLTFTRSKNNKKKKQKTGDGTSCDTVPGSDSSWIMTEYMLPEEDYKFQELVLCKIHENKKSKKKDDHHEPSEEGNMVHQIDALSTIGTVPDFEAFSALIRDDPNMEWMELMGWMDQAQLPNL